MNSFLSPRLGAQKRKVDLCRRKSATKFLCAKTVGDRVVRHSLACLTLHKWLMADVPFYLKCLAKCTHPLKIDDFESTFARSVSAVTSSEKSSIITNRKSTKSFPMSVRLTTYVARKPQKCQKHKSGFFSYKTGFIV